MFIGDWIEIKFISQNDEEMLFGFLHRVYDGFPLDENDEPDFNQEPIQVGRFSIGLFLITLNIYYK